MRHAQWEHQRREFANKHEPARAYLWQPRTGKTKMIIDNACYLAEACEIDGVLIIAPNGVHRQWIEEEVPKHIWKGRPHHYHGFAWRFSNPKNTEDFEAWFKYTGAYVSWLAVNMEALIRPEVKKALARFFKAKYSVMVVFDESHHFGRPGSKRSRLARGIARLGAYRRILSGTVDENSPLQNWSQYELLERGALGYRTYTEFKQHHAVYVTRRLRGGRHFPALDHYVDLETLKERKARYSSVVLRDDCADLPPIQQVNRLVELTTAQRKWWKDVKDEEIEFLEKMDQRKGLYGGAAFVKLQQIEGGFWKRPDGRIEHIVPVESNPKMLILGDELAQYDGQVIVWFQFIHELEAAYAVLGNVAGRFHGSATARDRDLMAFKAGRLRVMLAQPAAAGEGRDLSGKSCGMIIWYSQTPDARLRRQANERATVKGGGSVQIIDMVAPGGVDARWQSIADRKTETADDTSRAGLREVLENMNV